MVPLVQSERDLAAVSLYIYPVCVSLYVHHNCKVIFVIRLVDISQEDSQGGYAEFVLSGSDSHCVCVCLCESVVVVGGGVRMCIHEIAARQCRMIARE